MCGLLVLALLLPGISGALEPRAKDRPGGRVLATPDGFCWTEDIRLTDSANPDTHPALAVDSSGDANVIWYRSQSPGTHFYVKLDSTGRRLFDNVTLGTGYLPSQESGQVDDRSGIDAGDNFHILWTTSVSYGPMYKKFDAGGEALTPTMNLANIASMPHAFGMAVGANGCAYLAYVNEGSQRIEMAYLDGNASVRGPFFTGTTGDGVTIGVDRNDCPYVFSWSNSNTNLYMTKFDPQGSRLLAPAVVNTSFIVGRYNPMPVLAFGPDGAIHLLQANIMSQNHTLAYRKLSADGGTLTPSIPITYTASDQGDVCIGPGNETWIAWGDATDGKLRYLRVEPGKENETREPLVLTEGDGIDSSPQLSFGSDGRVHLVWASDRDGNSEIYYKSGLKGGIGLDMSQQEMEDIFWFHPDRTRRANLSVRNLCVLDDTALVEVSADFRGAPGGVGGDYNGSGWKVWLEPRYESIDLDGLGDGQVQVSVRSPTKGAQHERIDILVRATSGSYPPGNDSVPFSVCLVVDHEVRLGCANETASAVPGTQARFEIRVENPGDIDDEIMLAAESSLGWPARLGCDLLVLEKGGSAAVTLDVSLPESARAGQICNVTVTGRSAFEPAVQGSVKVSVVIPAFMDLRILPDIDESPVEPGGIAAFWFLVEARSDLSLTFFLEVSVSAGDWNAEPDRPSIFLDGSDSDRFEVRVAAPANARAGERAVINVGCADASRTYTAGCSVAAIAGSQRRLSVAPSPGALALDPGGSASFLVDVVNPGNGPDTARLELLEVPPGWNSSVEVLDGTAAGDATLYLVQNGSGHFGVTVSAPADAAAGEYRLAGRVADGDGSPYPFGIAASVVRTFGVRLQAPAPQVAGEQGSVVALTLEVTNAGNGPDSIRFCATGLPAGWGAAQLRAPDGGIIEWLDLDARRAAQISVLVVIPLFTALDAAGFRVTATDAGGASASADLSVAVRKPDLVIARTAILARDRTVGTPVMVTVTAGNAGIAAAHNVTLSYVRNGVVRTTENLGTILPGSERTLTLVWVPENGTNVLEFVLDPQNAIAEVNESNNDMVLTTEAARPAVEAPEEGGWAFPAAIAIVPAVAVALALAVTGWIALRTRRAPLGRGARWKDPGREERKQLNK